MRASNRHLLYLILVFISVVISPLSASLNFPSTEQAKAERLAPCAACKVLTESFKKEFDRTKRGKFEGGDSAWEEDKLKSYARSEVRLTEIQENLCKDLKKGETQCHDLAGEFESAIEEWWSEHQDTHPDIYVYICIDQMKRCCPKDHFGSQCKKCPGFPSKVCNNNGKCRGSGTRKGNGTCLCDKNYKGESCSECASGYYESYKDEDKLLCSSCHLACAKECTGGGPGKCDGGCTEGWRVLENEGCVDINECLEKKNPCSGNEFCVNTDGNFTCLACDRACNGCNGDGPDMCIECAKGHHKKDNICINSDILGRKKTENMARYATYFGLCAATCIILQKNVYAASVIGLFIGLYISVSEYMIATTGVQNASPNFDFLSPTD